jgi:two-component system chemotaxis response regulator CheY
MQIILENSEQRLLKDLRSLWQGQPEHRCLQLRFSQAEKFNDEWPDLISRALKSFFEDILLDVFVCQDHDIFIINRTMTNKRIAQLLTHLKPELGLASEEIAGLASLYEIGVDWPKLRSICEKKIENIRIKKEHADNELMLNTSNKNASNEEKDLAFKQAKIELTASLEKRRNKRKIAEIMVIEDDPLSQRLISNVLKDAFNYTILSDGRNASMTYLIKAPDVLFLDINLPDTSGHIILKKIFEIDPEAYIIMFSGNGDKENVLKAVNLGAKGFLGKPFTREKLMQYIKKSPHMKNKWG